MEFSEIILKYLTEKKISPATIAKATGIDKSTFSKWKNKPTSKLDFQTVVKISEYLGISIDTLVFGEKKSQIQNLTPKEQDLLKYYNELTEYEQVKLIGRAELLAERSDEHIKAENNKPKISMTTINIAEVAAGAGVSTPFTIDNAFSPRDFPAHAVPVEADCGVPINGDSMEPQYPNGCIAWVKCTDTADPGDVIIAVLNGEPYCKIYQPDGLHSYNKSYETIHIYEQDNFSIFGKVVGNFVG